MSIWDGYILSPDHPWTAHWGLCRQRSCTWPCMVMMKTVEERLQTTMWSRFWGNRCTLLTASSPVPA